MVHGNQNLIQLTSAAPLFLVIGQLNNLIKSYYQILQSNYY